MASSIMDTTVSIVEAGATVMVATGAVVFVAKGLQALIALL